MEATTRPPPRLDVRRGFARLARATAVGYWLLAAAVIGYVWWQRMHDYMPASYTYAWNWGRMPEAIQQAGTATVILTVIYAAFWAIFRGIRWIALGFMGD